MSLLLLRKLAPSALLMGMAFPLAAVDLPDGPGKAETAKLCTQCHDLAKSVSMRQDRTGWGVTMLRMAGMGMKATDKELETVLGYLAEHFPPGELPPLNVNKARAIEFESRLSLLRSEAARIIRHRRQHGDFRSIDELLAVPGMPQDKIKAKQGQIVF